MRMKYVLPQIVVLIVSLLMPMSLWAQQSIDEADSRFEAGDYKVAVSFYQVIMRAYQIQNRSTYDVERKLSKAKECQNLMNVAERNYKRQYYTKAIECYNKIKGINPSDPNIDDRIKLCERGRDQYLANKAIETEWGNAKTLQALYDFIKKYPNSAYEDEAKERIRKLEIVADEERWNGANRSGTTISYEGYLSRKTSYSQHVEEAKRKLAQLYEKEGNESFSLGLYSFALSSYKKAISNGGNLEKSENYQYCRFQAEDNWKTNSTAISDYLVRFPNGKFTSVVRGYKVRNEVRNGHFDEARREVNRPGSIYDNDTYRNSNWWLDYIKAKEREYKKQTRGQNRIALPLTIPISAGLASSIGESTAGSRHTGGKWGIGLGIGGYSNLLNIDAMYFRYPGAKSFVVIAPTFNVLQSLPPYRSVHLSIRPEFGYGFNSGNLFGARVGVGGRFLDVSGGASYIQDFGTYVDLSLRFNLYL